MEVPIRVLVVEDEVTNAILLKRILTKSGYSVSTAHNGNDALKILEKETFSAVLTDWMMPQVDGIELIRQIRQTSSAMPFIIMITALVSEGARSYALESGADDYIAKPLDVEELLTRLKDGLERRLQEEPVIIRSVESRIVDTKPPFVAVAIATSTGGPPTLMEILNNINSKINAAFYIVQHGPPWMLETFSQRLQKDCPLTVTLAINGLKSEKGNVYISPGDKHLKIDSKTFKLILDDGPKENFVRPSADPLFRSVAEAFGKYSIGVMLTGLGRDGAMGAAQIASVKGTVLVQDPDTAVAPSMPLTVLNSGIPCKKVHIHDMAKAIYDSVYPLALALG
jgi:two-component system chemotaxis response regulator CheB